MRSGAKNSLNPRAAGEIVNVTRLQSRAPVDTTSLEGTHSILLPDTNMVLAVEWDATQVFQLGRWYQWHPSNMKRAWNQKHGRRIQIGQYTMMVGQVSDFLKICPDIQSKPFHPIMLDTIATIVELVENGGAGSLGAVSSLQVEIGFAADDQIDLTGPGPL